MIIFEGADNSGKSTAVKQVLHKVPNLIFAGHSGGPPKSQEEWLERMDRQLLKTPSETVPVVLDRFFFSEKVYSKALGRTPAVPDFRMDILEERLLEHDPLIVYCRRPVHRLLQGWDEREQLDGVKENLTKVCLEYDKLFSQGWQIGGRLMVYNFEEPMALHSLCYQIEEYLMERGM